MNNKNIPKKNYLIMIVMIIVVVFFTFLIFSIIGSIKNKKINSGYINKYVSELQYSELDTYLVEPANNTFIYLTYTGNEDIYNLETKLKKLINSYELESNFIYVDLTDEINNNDYINEINNKVKSDKKIKALPVILYYKDGVLIDIVEGNDGIFNVGDFQQLLDKYEIAS